jgi:hypothetical protein
MPKEPTPPPVGKPELHPPPEPIDPKTREKNEYRPAAQDIESPEHLSMVENFIGTIYGQAKQIDSTQIGDSEFTKGLKFDAKQEIMNVRNEVKQRKGVPPQSAPQPQIPAPVQPGPVYNSSQPPVQHLAPPPTAIAAGDSLILKDEIEKIKEQVKDIKRLYDEFFKLKQVKGEWVITANKKGQKAPSITKAWNILNKLLKNKTAHITIEYKEVDE